MSLPKEFSGEARGDALRQAGRGTSKVKLVLSEIKNDVYMEAAGTVSLPSRRAIQGGPRVLDGNEALTFEDIGLSQERDAYRCRNSPVSSAQGRGVDEREGEEKRKRKVKDQNCLSRIVLRPASASQKKTFPAVPPDQQKKNECWTEKIGSKNVLKSLCFASSSPSFPPSLPLNPFPSSVLSIFVQTRGGIVVNSTFLTAIIRC